MHPRVQRQLDDAWVGPFGFADDAVGAVVGEEHVVRHGAEPGLRYIRV